MPPKTRNAAKQPSKKKSTTSSKNAKAAAKVAAVSETPSPVDPNMEKIISRVPRCSAPRGVKRPASPATYEGFERGSKKPKSFFSPYSGVYEKVIESVLNEARISGKLKPESTAVAIAKPISDALDGHFFLEFCKRHAGITHRLYGAEEESRELKDKVEELEHALGAAMEENDDLRNELFHLAQGEEASSPSNSTNSSGSDSDSDSNDE